MILTELEPETLGYPGIITGPPNELGTARSTDTLHLSTIYRDLEDTAIKQQRPDITEAELAFYAAGGFIWERVWAHAHLEAITGGDIVRPGEVELDGIVGSPDGMRISEWRVIDTKCVWMSSNKLDALEKYRWVWLVQMKGYCKMMCTDEAELHVFCVNGNWRPPVPCERVFLLQFDQQEIDESWRMIVQHAQRRGWL